MKVNQIVGEVSVAKLNEGPYDSAVLARVAELKATNPQFAAEVRKVPPIVRGILPDSAKHNAMVIQQLDSLVKKYSGNPVQEELPAPGQELGTIGAVKPDGTVEVKKADGSSTVVQQQELKPGATPNTLTMPVPKINPGEKVMAAPVAEGAELTAMLRIAGLR